MTIEPNRPLFHFTPPINWMNDPNGLVWHNGEYHLYYQHNPYGKGWGHMSWGHAISADLLHWRHLPIALFEQPQRGYTIFSGSAVVDVRNTSGFGRDGCAPIVAVYTADYHPARPLEDIHIAYSLDDGRTFTEYAGNPVLRVHNPKFGDPKVFWHVPTERWIMVAIHGAEQGWVDLYASPNLKDWTFLSAFHAPQAVPGMWECPDLFPLVAPDGSERWVLKVNTVLPNQGGSITRYFVGYFDGWTFQADPATPQMIYPDGDPIYAEVTYNNEPQGRRILLGWLRQTPREDRPWTGMQSIPREVCLREIDGQWRLCHRPAIEMQSLRRAHHVATCFNLSGAGPAPNTPNSAHEVDRGGWEIAARFDPGTADECGIEVDLAHNAIARAGYSAATGEVFIDAPGRPRSALPLRQAGGPVDVHVFVDRGVIELFGGQGQVALSALLEPETACLGLGVFAFDGVARLAHLDMWRLERVDGDV
ncbi:MAG: glycoside hydrolase family 32 protein [Anaerolineae bacterium]|nr:glycoside hydrolase family 32 protein [Thermoflexales bacterium]MDW8407657.1 glycoside hydrolase family 32 protein [Anaerolineae bacterium]